MLWESCAGQSVDYVGSTNLINAGSLLRICPVFKHLFRANSQVHVSINTSSKIKDFLFNVFVTKLLASLLWFLDNQWLRSAKFEVIKIILIFWYWQKRINKKLMIKAETIRNLHIHLNSTVSLSEASCSSESTKINVSQTTFSWRPVPHWCPL